MGMASAWMVSVILGRELGVTVLRSMAHVRGVTIAASALGKFKMITEVIAILLLMLGTQAWIFFAIGQVALWFVLITALVSAWDYYRRYSGVLMDPKIDGFEIRKRKNG
jgi:CDP-diacylglycerol--glycerol-3-phosphate 3-phosphatidyltransferase